MPRSLWYTFAAQYATKKEHNIIQHYIVYASFFCFGPRQKENTFYCKGKYAFITTAVEKCTDPTCIQQLQNYILITYVTNPVHTGPSSQR